MTPCVPAHLHRAARALRRPRRLLHSHRLYRPLQALRLRAGHGQARKNSRASSRSVQAAEAAPPGRRKAAPRRTGNGDQERTTPCPAAPAAPLGSWCSGDGQRRERARRSGITQHHHRGLRSTQFKIPASRWKRSLQPHERTAQAHARRSACRGARPHLRAGSIVAVTLRRWRRGDPALPTSRPAPAWPCSRIAPRDRRRSSGRVSVVVLAFGVGTSR